MSNSEIDILGTQENPPLEEVAQSISAAFDSVNFINSIINGTSRINATEENKKAIVERNVSHLKIMLEKEWFTGGCTETQFTDLNAAIIAGEGYIA